MNDDDPHAATILADSHETHKRAAQIVAAGGVIAFRTDTFYGLGADPFNRDALAAIKALKGREDDKPILVVISDPSEIVRFVDAPTPLFERVTARHWPGALTVVARARAAVPHELTSGTGKIGVRLPDDDAVRDLVRACGGALTATSANRAGEPPARSAPEVAAYFPEGLALIVDAGATRAEHPSTVLDVSEPAASLIREGVISRRELEETLRAIGASLE